VHTTFWLEIIVGDLGIILNWISGKLCEGVDWIELAHEGIWWWTYKYDTPSSSVKTRNFLTGWISLVSCFHGGRWQLCFRWRWI